MDLSVKTSPLLSWRQDHQRLLPVHARTFSSQLNVLARRVENRRVLARCSASAGGGESVDVKKGSKTATLEAADDVDPGFWLESQGQPDPFFGWISSGYQQAKTSNVAGWITIGGVTVLTLGFALGARSLYLKRDVAKQFTVARPATEETVPSSKTANSEGKLQTADPQERNEVSERNSDDVQAANQNHNEKNAIDKEVKDDETQQLVNPQNNGSENQLTVDSGVNDDPPSVSNPDKAGDIDEQLKPSTATEQFPSQHTAVVDVATTDVIDKSDVSDEVLLSEPAERAEVTGKDSMQSFTYADGDDINAVFESDVSDRLLGEDSTFDDSFLPSDDLYEGMPTKNSDIEGNEVLSRLEDYTDIVSQKDGQRGAPVQGREGYLIAAITAPSTPSENSASSLGDVKVPAHVDHMQEQILAALQALKVIEADVKAGDICTRREYARWLMSASALLTSAAHKVIPAMYLENASVLAYEDVNPEDKDFPVIQGLAEAGLLSSRLIEEGCGDGVKESMTSIFSPDSYLTRQDLVTWKVALERKPPVMEGIPTGTELMALQDVLGFVDLDKIQKDALPAFLVDMTAGEQSITALTFGHTRRLQPQKLATKGQAAVAIATGEAWEFVSEELARLEAESVAEAAIVAELALEAKAQEEVAAAFEKLLQTEREKQKASTSLTESLQMELEEIKSAYEAEKLGLLKDRAAIEAERDLLSRAKLEVEQQASALSNAKVEAAFNQEQAEKLRREAEQDRFLVSSVRAELEVEKNALVLARSWAEDEARKAQEHSRILELTRKRLEDHDSAVFANREADRSPERVTNSSPSIQDIRETQVEETPVPELENISREPQVEKSLTDWFFDKSKEAGQRIVDACVWFMHFVQLMFHTIIQWVTNLYSQTRGKLQEVGSNCAESTAKTAENLKQAVPSSVAGLTSSVREGTLKMVDELKGGAERLTQKSKTS